MNRRPCEHCGKKPIPTRATLATERGFIAAFLAWGLVFMGSVLLSLFIPLEQGVVHFTLPTAMLIAWLLAFAFGEEPSKDA